MNFSVNSAFSPIVCSENIGLIYKVVPFTEFGLHFRTFSSDVNRSDGCKTMINGSSDYFFKWLESWIRSPSFAFFFSCWFSERITFVTKRMTNVLARNGRPLSSIVIHYVVSYSLTCIDCDIHNAFIKCPLFTSHRMAPMLNTIIVEPIPHYNFELLMVLFICTLHKVMAYKWGLMYLLRS